jgi:hypothetical protein
MDIVIIKILNKFIESIKHKKTCTIPVFVFHKLVAFLILLQHTDIFASRHNNYSIAINYIYLILLIHFSYCT